MEMSVVLFQGEDIITASNLTEHDADGNYFDVDFGELFGF